jgi:protein-serine/threonine kinase
MKQLLNAFAFLHEHDIIHRDIKLENVLVVMTPEQLNQLRKRNIEVVHNMKFKLADMGLAKKLGHKDDLT